MSSIVKSRNDPLGRSCNVQCTVKTTLIKIHSAISQYCQCCAEIRLFLMAGEVLNPPHRLMGTCKTVKASHACVLLSGEEDKKSIDMIKRLIGEVHCPISKETDVKPVRLSCWSILEPIIAN